MNDDNKLPHCIRPHGYCPYRIFNDCDYWGNTCYLSRMEYGLI